MRYLQILREINNLAEDARYLFEMNEIQVGSKHVEELLHLLGSNTQQTLFIIFTQYVPYLVITLL